MFFPLHDNIQHDSTYRQKFIYNHERYLGEETALCIQGLCSLSTRIKLKNDQIVPLRMLLRSLPASKGMTRSQLFQLVENNPTGMVVLATYQHCDKDLVHARKESLEQEIRTQLAEGESVKVFQSDTREYGLMPLARLRMGNYGQINTLQSTMLIIFSIKTGCSPRPPRNASMQPQ